MCVNCECSRFSNYTVRLRLMLTRRLWKLFLENAWIYATACVSDGDTEINIVLAQEYGSEIIIIVCCDNFKCVMGVRCGVHIEIIIIRKCIRLTESTQNAMQPCTTHKSMQPRCEDDGDRTVPRTKWLKCAIQFIALQCAPLHTDRQRKAIKTVGTYS